MPIDPRIPLGYNPVQINTPFQNLNIVMEARQREQTVQENERKLRAQEQTERDSAAVRQILRESDGDWRIALPRIRATVSHETAFEIEKTLGEQRKAAADVAGKEFANEKAESDDVLSLIEVALKRPELYPKLKPLLEERVPKLRGAFPDPAHPERDQVLRGLQQAGVTVGKQAENNQAWLTGAAEGKYDGFERAYAAADDDEERESAVQIARHLGMPEDAINLAIRAAQVEAGESFTLTPGGKRFNAKGEVIAEVPANEGGSAGFTLSPGQVRYGPDGKPIASRPASSGGGGRSGLSAGDLKFVDAIIRNPAIYASLTPTRKTELAQALSERGFTFENAGRPATASQRRVLNYFNRAKQADEELERIEEKISQLGLVGQAGLKIWNPLQSDLAQAYNQARRTWTEARLRKESGAAIMRSEYDNDDRTSFAQPGDGPAVIKQKRRARAETLRSMALEAGPALREDLGDETDEVLSTYRARASGQDAGATPAAGGTPQRRPIPGIPGAEAELRNGRWVRVK